MLKQWITDTFTDYNKSGEMMGGECSSGEEYNWGYGPELEAFGVAYTLVADHGGEDQGSDYYSVYEFSKGDEIVLVKFQGWYASFDGAEYHHWSFVTPKKVERVEYV